MDERVFLAEVGDPAPPWSGEADPIVNAERWMGTDDRKGSSRNSRKAT